MINSANLVILLQSLAVEIGGKFACAKFGRGNWWEICMCKVWLWKFKREICEENTTVIVKNRLNLHGYYKISNLILILVI